MEKRLKYLIAAIIILFYGSCNDSEFLKEEPLDFLTPTNSYNTPDGIEQGVDGLYSSIREKWYSNNIPLQSYGLFGLGTDVAYDGETPEGQRFLTNYETTITPQEPLIETWWLTLFNQIQRANLLIHSIDNVVDNDEWANEEQKNHFLSEARFFRAWCYRIAVTLWGDIPLITEVIEEAKVDFQRAPVGSIYELIEEDLAFASENLPSPGEEAKPGRLTKGAALHLLTEVYLAEEKFDLAVNSASKVIDEMGYSLMTERFGNQFNVFGTGDVYWDLFRYDNQNPPLNKETIWAIQFEPNQELGGGGNYWSGIYGPRLEKFGLAPDGKPAFENVYSDTLGVQVARARGTSLVFYDVWENDWENDIRNAPHNIKRDFYYENPNSSYNGEKIDLSEFSSGARNSLKDTTNFMYPFFMKGWQPVVQATISDKSKGGGGTIHTDFYAMRLAETYLLRAEAYLGLNEKKSAAEDVNKVRSRAKATPVKEEEVDLDFILDERIRELYAEEMRMIVLLRTNKLVERTKKYHDNPLLPGANIQEHNKLWPIPQSQIDLNYDADFDQNPGY